MSVDSYSRLRRRVSDETGAPIQSNISLARYTSYRIGGEADLFLEPPSVETLASALRAAHESQVPVTVLGGGTNVLVSDRGVRGLVLRLGRAFDYRRWAEQDGGAAVVLKAGAASRLGKVVAEAVERGWAGLEFAAGIPGSVGGGVLMNAGAFGGEIGEVIEAVAGVSMTGKIAELSRERLNFSYRRVALDVDVVVTSVRFRLLRSSVGRLRQVVESVQRKRRSRQPLRLPNAGSVFRNPPALSAGRLIEQAGLKGRTAGGAQVSPEHANFIVNLGGARASDVRDLMRTVQREVWQRSGVWLEPEVRLIGDWE